MFFKDWEMINIVLFFLLIVFLGIIVVAFIIMFTCWLIFTFIKKNNLKNQPAGNYLKAILKQEGYKFKIQIKKMTMRYLNVKYQEKIINLKVSDEQSSNIWNIYNVLTYVQRIKWKEANKWYVGMLHVATVLFALSIIGFIMMVSLAITYNGSLITIPVFNLSFKIGGYFAIICLLLGWCTWVYYYELMRKDLLELADNYLESQDYRRIRLITNLKMITLGSESLLKFTW